MGNAFYELITPLKGESVYSDHLNRNGEGFHHTCFAYSDLETMQAARDELIKQGKRMIQQGFTEGIFEFCYFEMGEADMILELLYLKELPPPEKSIG